MRTQNGGSATVLYKNTKNEDVECTNCCFELTSSVLKCLLIFAVIAMFANIILQQEDGTSQAYTNFVTESVADFYGPSKTLWDNLVGWMYYMLLIPFSTAWMWITIPVIMGLIVSMMSLHAVYMDSEKPGESPPIPFSPRKNGAKPGRNTISLNYAMAIVSGVMTFLVLFLDFEDLFTEK